MPKRTHTHTYAILAIGQVAFDEIHAKLSDAGYTHLFSRDTNGRLIIQMEGIALASAAGQHQTRAAEGRRKGKAGELETIEDEPLAMVNSMAGNCAWYPIVPGTIRGRWALVSSRTFNDGSGKGKLYMNRRCIGRVDYMDGIFLFKEPRHQAFVSFKFKP